jgi:hypothetical protein
MTTNPVVTEITLVTNCVIFVEFHNHACYWDWGSLESNVFFETYCICLNFHS